MDPRLSAPPPAPFCDCYATQHSAEATWASSAPADTVYKALRRAVSSPAHEGVLLRAPTPFEECAYYGSSVTAFLSSAAASSGEKERQDGDPRADVSVVRVSPSAGFRDFVAFYVLPAVGSGGGGGISGNTAGGDPAEGSGSNSGSKVVARGRSLDYHVWTACPCCRGTAWCKYAACFFCCCGMCPTKDWGQNMQTLENIVADANVGLQHVKDPSDALSSLNHNPQKYNHPEAIDASRRA